MAGNSSFFQTIKKNIRLTNLKLEYDLQDTDINWLQYSLVEVTIGDVEWVQTKQVKLIIGSGPGIMQFQKNPFMADVGEEAIIEVKKRSSSAAFPAVLSQEQLLELQQLLRLQE